MSRRMNQEVNILTSELMPEKFTSNVPVMIKQDMGQRPRFFDWDPGQLREKIGDKLVLVDHSHDGLFRVDPDAATYEDKMEKLPFNSFLDKISHNPATRDYLYLIHSSIPGHYPELMKEIDIPHYVDQERLRHINLWVGQAGNVSPLHFDTNNNVLCEIYGRKKIFIYPPNQMSLLYPYSCFSRAPYVSPVRVTEPDLDKHPKFSQAKPVEIILHPGDILYIPPFWWHQVYNLDLTISVNFWWSLYRHQCWQRSYARIVIYRLYNRCMDFLKRSVIPEQGSS
ncbi:cupin-like domain-containing protein [Legionella spiritensis]|uniref:cupin-like domain-containing protein n=1 Tax=Legionella spiritensis TaxID=452 RepID=UPI000F8398A7|nr:cupin-like domain-containing protein [Legionella spiritensis]